MKFFCAYTLLLFASLCIGACGSGDKEPSARTPTSSDLTTLATRAVPTASDALLEAALLTPEDLGEGWLRQASQGRPTTVADNYYCGEKLSSIPFTAGAIYSNQEERVIFMIQAFSKLESEEAARVDLNARREAAKDCDEWISTDGVTRTEWKIEIAETPALGDDSFTLLAKGQLEGAPAPSEAYFFQVRYGSTIMSVAPVYAGDASLQGALRVLEAADGRFTRLADE